MVYYLSNTQSRSRIQVDRQKKLPIHDQKQLFLLVKDALYGDLRDLYYESVFSEERIELGETTACEEAFKGISITFDKNEKLMYKENLILRITYDGEYLSMVFYLILKRSILTSSNAYKNEYASSITSIADTIEEKPREMYNMGDDELDLSEEEEEEEIEFDDDGGIMERRTVTLRSPKITSSIRQFLNSSSPTDYHYHQSTQPTFTLRSPLLKKTPEYYELPTLVEEEDKEDLNDVDQYDSYIDSLLLKGTQHAVVVEEEEVEEDASNQILEQLQRIKQLPKEVDEQQSEKEVEKEREEQKSKDKRQKEEEQRQKEEEERQKEQDEKNLSLLSSILSRKKATPPIYDTTDPPLAAGPKKKDDIKDPFNMSMKY
eukprot:CAMPEP_0117424172 /NCGR_PEP_ID=MMETSP0758-20121206/4645_1 /TAXON_ID=63605 /ORGANISM="Percolomonas cosmopolitus, Strain AE-1 (ATCC 50343)" /LENGTH=373 /DNA_ID=CAMNT_0005207793 /DNA_START=148 /DNA_END=1269 /DNA_ORIENTATION=+